VKGQQISRMKKYGIVIDTSVLVSALKSRRGASFKILSLIPSVKFEFHLSVPLVFEYESALKRAKLGIQLAGDEIDELLDIICFFGSKQIIWYLWRPLLQDAGDEFVAELAITSQADIIVTHNVRDFKGVEKFGIRALTPKEFLQEIGETK
jgi:putative PIN family toxin of toxin-antitoxin system